MSKYFKTAAAALALVALAAPAMADSQISGYYRMQAMTDTVNGAPADNKKAESQIDQRFRLRYQNNLNEYVHFVYFGEVDAAFGQTSKGAIGGGGKSSADGVNVETKNVYLDFKIPDSIFSFRLGTQGFGDNFQNVFVADDMSGVQANMAFTPALGTTLAYFKFDEGTSKTKWDDVDLYALKNKLKVNDNFNLNFDFYYLDDNRDAPARAAALDVLVSGDTDNDGVLDAGEVWIYGDRGVVNEVPDTDLYTVGVSADAKLGTIGLDGFVAYQLGEKEFIARTEDIDAWVASAKAKMDIGAAKTGLRLTYYSEDDSAQDDGSFGEIAAGAFQFAGENLSIFYSDVFYNNTSGGRHAITDAAEAGYGLFAVNATADFKFPSDYYLKTGAGYFMSLEDQVSLPTPAATALTKKQGETLGFEVAARVGTIVAKKVDVSLNGAYAFLGDFYDAAPGGQDPDNMYKLNFMVNVPF